jgi:hypothetical protein
MKQFWFGMRATLTCLISPSRFASLAKEYAIPRTEGFDNLEKQTLGHAQIIQRAFWLSLFLTVGALVTGYAAGWVLRHFLCAASNTVATSVQALSAAIVLVATLAAQGWNIQTSNGQTLPEKVNQWLTRSLFVVGTFFFSLFLGWAP